MTFQLWDIGADRLLAAFDTESAALDAAYHALLDRVPRSLAVRRAAATDASRAGARRGWRSLPGLALAALYSPS